MYIYYENFSKVIPLIFFNFEKNNLELNNYLNLLGAKKFYNLFGTINSRN